MDQGLSTTAPRKRKSRQGSSRVLQLGNVTFDCAQPVRLAEFWAAATGYEIKESSDFLVRLSPPDGSRPHLLMIKVPEPKMAKNRVHLDFGVADREAEVERLTALGAARGETHHKGGFI